MIDYYQWLIQLPQAAAPRGANCRISLFAPNPNLDAQRASHENSESSCASGDDDDPLRPDPGGPEPAQRGSGT
jgi:hypothetical protein